MRVGPKASECNMVSHYVAVPEGVLETTDHRLASFFSKNYKSFSLTLIWVGGWVDNFTWFSLNSELVKAVTLAFCSIQ